MRLGNQTIVRNYTNNLSKNLNALNRANTTVASGNRRFSSMVDSPSLGVRAMKVRRSMDNLETYTDTAKTVNGKFKAAEDQMRQIGTLAKDMTARYTTALNGTVNAEDRGIMATELEALQKQFLTGANSKYSETFMFGGTNTTSAPFTLNSTNDLLYNGVKVADMADADGKVLPQYAYLMSDVNHVDLGLGLAMESGKVVDSTGFVSTLNGLDFMGIGKDNIYLVAGELITALRDPNFTNNDNFQGLLTKMQTATSNLYVGITSLGAQTSYLDSSITRMEDEMINLSERQNALEFVDPASALMEFKMQEYTYNAALQMGQRLLQPTLFNFIN